MATLPSVEARLLSTREPVTLLAQNETHARIQLASGQAVWRSLEELELGGSPAVSASAGGAATGGYAAEAAQAPISPEYRKVRFLHHLSTESWTRAVQLLKYAAEHGVKTEDDLCQLISKLRKCQTGVLYQPSLSALRQSIRKLEDPQLEFLQGAPEFLEGTVGWMAQHALSLPSCLPDGLSILAQCTNKQVVLSRRACAAIACTAFFGLLPKQHGDLPGYDLGFILDADAPKTMCLLSYLTQISREKADTLDEQYVSFARRSLPQKVISGSFWENLDAPLLPMEVVMEGTIEGATGALQADFANESLGGGVLHGGNVQEEIRFSVCPECLVGMLLCEVMLPHEAIFIVGAQQYSHYVGYGRSFAFQRPYVARDSLDSLQRPDVHIVALDALCFPGDHQYGKPMILRELQKAYVACLGDPSEADGSQELAPRLFATGNWGCGVFGGDPHLKSLIQWIAASANKRQVHYFVYGDKRVAELSSIVQVVSERGLRCRELVDVLIRCQEKKLQGMTIFNAVLQQLEAD